MEKYVIPQKYKGIVLSKKEMVICVVVKRQYRWLRFKRVVETVLVNCILHVVEKDPTMSDLSFGDCLTNYRWEVLEEYPTRELAEDALFELTGVCRS